MSVRSRPLVDRLRRFPGDGGVVHRAVQSISACSIRAWLAAYHRFEVVGREHLPAAESFVMVANHLSHLDALCLMSALPLSRLGQTYPAAAADYFFGSLPTLAVSVLVLNAIPFDRTGYPRESLDRCRRLLERPGSILILFPEGTRSSCETVGPFRAGVAALLADTPIPVVPCHLAGTHAALPKGAIVPRPRKVRLTIGSPLTYAKFDSSRESIRFICNELRTAVLALGAANPCMPAQHSMTGDSAVGSPPPRYGREKAENPPPTSLALASHLEST